MFIHAVQFALLIILAHAIFGYANEIRKGFDGIRSSDKQAQHDSLHKHVDEDLGNMMDTSKFTEKEYLYYHFVSHDLDKNQHLDGCEISKAFSHQFLHDPKVHVQGNALTPFEAATVSETDGILNKYQDKYGSINFNDYLRSLEGQKMA